MEIYFINLVYFIIVIPIILITFSIISKLCKDKKRLSIIIVLSLFLFTIRFILIFFQETIGIMPYLIEDVLFYGLLMILGVIMTWFYVIKIEKLSFKEIGCKIEDVKNSIIFGLLAYIPLICLFPLMTFLTNIQLSLDITLGKLIVAIAFGVLACFYEEIMFRGIIQNHFMEITDNNEKKTIMLTALVFTATHIFYLPFIGFGIFYIFVFTMALLLSILRVKFDLLACSILHGGIVFILIIFV